MTITFNSTADTAEIAAENAIMLSQDTGQVVNLVWKGRTLLVWREDSVEIIEILLLNPSLDSAAPLAGAAAEDLAEWEDDRAFREAQQEALTSEDEDQTPRWSCAPDDAFPVLFC